MVTSLNLKPERVIIVRFHFVQSGELDAIAISWQSETGIIGNEIASDQSISIPSATRLLLRSGEIEQRAP